MAKILVLGVLMLTLVLAGPLQLRPAQVLMDGQLVVADRVADAERIAIDGSLDEAVWQQPPLRQPFITMFPTYGKELEEETEVWVAYDDHNLYFAFRCYESKPDRIKTSVAQRDKIANDDQVGVWLDTIGTKQSSYEFYVNPNGIQMDGINSAVSAGDFTPDFVWESAGKLSADGFQVEVRIPLESIRYQVDRNNEVRMRGMFFRKITHLGALATWPEVKPGQSDFNCMNTLVYRGIQKGGLKLEILPNFTYSTDSRRVAVDTWEKSRDTNIGVSVKYGITSSITAEATVNPDFSQVESDVFQMEINQRYPLFYSEKRPFFMESQDVLDFTIVHDTMASVLERGMMISPIHTRRIVDPSWAAKLSGSSGRVNFALLAANDRSAGEGWLDVLNPDGRRSAFYSIFRAKYNLGEDNALGVLYTGRHFAPAGEHNDVGGIDLKYRLSGNLRASLSYLHSTTRAGEGQSLENGYGVNGVLQYLSSRLILMGAYERYSTDFYMASAIQNRVGISRFWFGIGPYINVNFKLLPWLKRLVPYLHYAHLHDLGTGQNDISRVFGLYMNLAPMGIVYLEYRSEDEAWQGKLFDKNYFIVLGDFQLSNWLHLYTNLYLGGQIYYHSDDPFLGTERTFDIGLTVEPSIKFKMGLNYVHSDFRHRQTSEEVYSANIYNLQAAYQFNKYFFVRAILRYDDLQDKLLTDFLASFTLIPGTVVHLGYGSLYLENQWQGDLSRMRQGLFFKASYLWRIK